VIEIVW